MQCKEVVLYYRPVEIQQVPKLHLKDHRGVFFVLFFSGLQYFPCNYFAAGVSILATRQLLSWLKCKYMIHCPCGALSIGL